MRLLVADGSGRVMTTSLPESGDHGLPCGQHREVECALSHSFLYVEVVPMPTGYKSPGFSRATTGAAPTTRIGGKCLQRERSPGSLWRTVVEFRSGHCGHSSTRAGVVTNHITQHMSLALTKQLAGRFETRPLGPEGGAGSRIVCGTAARSVAERKLYGGGSL